MVRYERTGEHRRPAVGEWFEGVHGPMERTDEWNPSNGYWILRRIELPKCSCGSTTFRVDSYSNNFETKSQTRCAQCGKPWPPEPEPGWGPLAVKQNEELKAKAAPAPRPTTEEVVEFLDLNTPEEIVDRIPVSRQEVLTAEAIRRVRVHEELRRHIASGPDVFSKGRLLAILDKEAP